MHDPDGPYITGKAPPEATRINRPASEKEKVELWFIDPLMKMKGDEAFICLMICFPLLETIMRHELGIADKDEVTLSDNSPALHWFSKFMTIPEKSAREVWDAFRNGLLHRAMIKGSIDYALTGERTKRPAQMADGRITIYVWDLRQSVVDKLREHHRKLWKGSRNDLPSIFFTA